jgi:hypothetical protein
MASRKRKENANDYTTSRFVPLPTRHLLLRPLILRGGGYPQKYSRSGGGETTIISIPVGKYSFKIRLNVDFVNPHFHNIHLHSRVLCARGRYCGCDCGCSGCGGSGRSGGMWCWWWWSWCCCLFVVFLVCVCGIYYKICYCLLVLFCICHYLYVFIVLLVIVVLVVVFVLFVLFVFYCSS